MWFKFKIKTTGKSEIHHLDPFGDDYVQPLLEHCAHFYLWTHLLPGLLMLINRCPNLFHSAKQIVSNCVPTTRQYWNVQYWNVAGHIIQTCIAFHWYKNPAALNAYVRWRKPIPVDHQSVAGLGMFWIWSIQMKHKQAILKNAFFIIKRYQKNKCSLHCKSRKTHCLHWSPKMQVY